MNNNNSQYKFKLEQQATQDLAKINHLVGKLENAIARARVDKRNAANALRVIASEHSGSVCMKINDVINQYLLVDGK
jgi:hypothetical protein